MTKYQKSPDGISVIQCVSTGTEGKSVISVLNSFLFCATPENVWDIFLIKKVKLIKNIYHLTLNII